MWGLWVADQLIDRVNPVVVSSAIRSVIQKVLLLTFCRQIFLWSFGASAKLWKVTVSFVVCVCLSVCSSVCPRGTTRLTLDGFSWNYMFEYFENLSRELEFRYYLSRITGTLHEHQYVFWSYLAQFFLESKIFQTKVLEKFKTHFLFNKFIFSKIVPFIGQSGEILYSWTSHRWQCGACAFHAGELRLHKHALRICNIYCFSAATVAAQTRLIVTLYVHSLSCYGLIDGIL